MRVNICYPEYLKKKVEERKKEQEKEEKNCSHKSFDRSFQGRSVGGKAEAIDFRVG
jgi:hypothetical protein